MQVRNKFQLGLLGISLLAILSFFSSCSTLRGYKKSAQVTFQKTACFGTCPIYKMVIDGNGDAKFTGERFTEKLGVWTKKLSKSETKELFKALKDLDWQSFREKYTVNISDLPSKIIRYSSGSLEKEIIMTGDAPEALEKMNTILHQIASSEGWQNQNTE